MNPEKVYQQKEEVSIVFSEFCLKEEGGLYD
jgi:hypothetical protein